jgi:predicted dehydrogenase
MKVSRRVFVGCGTAGVIRSAVPASERVNLGVIGCGWQGVPTLKIFRNDPRVHIAAVCDVDGDHLEEGKAAAGGTPAAVRHFEEIVNRADVDAVYIAVPDHWHGVVALAAARSGKDIYGEKPIAHNFAEAIAIRDAVRRYGRIWQTGSWQRSVSEFRHACELVRNGRIGKVHRVDIGLPPGHTDWDGLSERTLPVPPPPRLEYERWLGPAPEAPYCPARVHKTWRWNLDYGGGSLMDWVGHHVDIAHWALGLDDTGPLEVSASAEWSRHPVWNAPLRYRVTARYLGGLTMHISSGYDDVRGGIRWTGDEGWIWIDRGGMDASPRGVLTSRIGANETQLPVSSSHHRNFIDCVLSRSETLTPAHIATRSATPGYLGLIAMQTGRTIRWDPRSETVVSDPEAARLLARPMRTPWHL